MNNKEIATGVLKHPLIQEILKHKLAESSVVNRLIVEEIMMEDDLEEARSKLATSALQGIKRNLRVAKKAGKLDAFVEKYKGPLEQGKIPYGKWSEITDETEREQLLTFVRDTLISIKGDSQNTTQSIEKTDGQPPTNPIDLVLEMLAEAIAAKATEKLVTPILNKINKVGNALVVGQAGAGVVTGGATWFTAALTAIGKAAAGEMAQFVAETALQKAIKEILLKGFRMLPKAKEMENASETLTKVLGKNVWGYIEKEIKTKSATPDKIKSILVKYWDEILKNFIISSAGGQLGENLKEWSVELVTFAPGNVPVGPFLAGQLGLNAEQIAEISAEAAQIAALPEKEEPDDNEEDDEGGDLERRRSWRR